MRLSVLTHAQPCARLTMTVLAVSILAACGGGGGAKIKSHDATTPPLPARAAPWSGDRTASDDSIFEMRLRSSGPAPQPSPPTSATYNAAGVKVGVYDYGFEPDATQNHPAAVVRQLKEVLNTDHPMLGVHGSIVNRIIGGIDIGDGFPAGTASGFELYQVQQQRFFTARTLHDDFEALAARGVRIVNNSWGFDSDPVYALPDGAESRPDSFTTKVYFPALARAVHEDGQLLVWAVGNEGNAHPSNLAGAPYIDPTLEKGWLAVTQIRNGEAVPGVNLCGVAANWCMAAEAPAGLDGSSFSAPAVTAAAAQVSQAFPWMSNSELRQTLLSTADHVGPKELFGWGQLNNDKAVRGPGLFDTRLTLGGDFVADTKGYDAAFYNNIGGNAGLIKTGAGALTLWGENTYAGNTRVNGGTLALYGSVATSVSVDSNAGLLINGGRIGGSLDNAGTVVAEGVGMKVQGDYTATSDAVLKTQLGTEVAIKGKAFLNDSTLLITNSKNVYVGALTETALTAGEVVGTFGQVIPEAGLLHQIGTPQYSTDSVVLPVTRADVADFASRSYAGLTSRQGAAQAVETAFLQADQRATGGASVVTDDFLDGAATLQSERSWSALGRSFDSFSGQIHASAQALTFQQSQAVNRALSDRIDLLGQRQAQTGPWAGIAAANGKLEKSGFAKADTGLVGGQVGLDHRVAPQTVVGAALAFSHANARFDQYGGKSDSQSVGLSLYGRQGGELGSYVSGRIGHEWIKTDTRRDILLGEHTTGVKSDRTDRLASFYGELGHIFGFDALNAVPFVGLSYDRLERGAIKESGHAFALNASKKSYDQSAALLGLRLQSTALSWAGGLATVNAYGAYRHGKATRLDYVAAFSGAPDAGFTVEGIGLQRHTGWLGLGANTAVTNRLSWNVNYDMQLGRGGIDNTILSLGMRYAFGS